LLVILFLGIGFLSEKVFSRIFIKGYFNFPPDKSGRQADEKPEENLCNTGKISALVVKALPNIIKLSIFAAVSFLSFSTLMPIPTPFLRLFFLSTLLTIALIRLVVILSQIIFSPSVNEFRIVPLCSNTALNLHHLIAWSASYIIVTLMFSIVTYKLGAQLETMQLLQFIFVSILLFATILAVIRFRNTIKNQILSGPDQGPSWGRRTFAGMWHILTIGYLLAIWLLLLQVDYSTETETSHSAFFISFFIVPIWLIVNRLVQWLVELTGKTLKIYDDNPHLKLSDEELAQNESGKQFIDRCRTFAKVVLMVVLALWIAKLWGYSLPFLSRFTAVFFDAAIIMTLSLLFWQFISNWIEKKIQETIPEEKEEDKQDDEWGAGAVRGRSYTLLPMIRKFIGSVLVIMVTMTLLSSMGVDIGPLLAGAGVVGLAVGFGAQKLVADMFSGFFYLLDDAFRVGEYLEAGSVSGMVENITLRNVMLRHHRGMLQIVPHSELGPITNFMRGGIVVKFNLDFPYDADIDKIRKVIKKVGQAMLENEEFGKDFIKPVKSQGVREISNSVMTIRVKFTAQPGTHFVIRREAFKRITEELKKQGINYAHRKVIVDLPDNVTSLSPKELKEVAGAAAMRSMEEGESHSSTNAV